MKYVSNLIKAIIVGFISCAIPGLSSLTFAIVLCIYYPLIDALSSLFKNFKKNLVFLIIFFTGYIIGAILAAKFVSALYENYPLIFVLAIFGCLAGSLPKMIKDILPFIKDWTNWLLLGLIVAFFIGYVYFVVGSEAIELDFEMMTFIDYLKLFGVGLVTSITFAMPGLDFAVILLAFGYYYPLMSLISEVASFNNFFGNGSILLVYTAGYVLGIYLISKLIKAFIMKHKGKMRFATLAFILVSPLMMIKSGILDAAGVNYANADITLGIILAVILFFIVMLIYHLNNPDDTRIEAMKKRHMLRFYFTILIKLPLTLKYLKGMRKIIKENKLTFEERYAYIQEELHVINHLGNIRMHSYGQEYLSDQATLYIVNHQGRYDGIGILTGLMHHPTTLIVDQSRVKWPFYRELCIMLECAYLDYQNPRSMVRTLDEVAEKLKGGRSYIAFIEGKYGNNENTLQEFKTGVLRPAYESGVTIIPAVLYDTYKVYGKSSIRRIHPEVHFLQPITYDEYANLSKQELADLLKQRMQEKLDTIEDEKNQAKRKRRKK